MMSLLDNYWTLIGYWSALCSMLCCSDQTRQNAKRTGDVSKQEGLEGMEMEEEKRFLIHREIDKFRDTYKVRVLIVL